MKNNIIYKTDIKPTCAQVIALYTHCSLGARRPLDDQTRLQSMLDHANLIITAWEGDRLVGIARCLTDFSYVTYLADLAVDDGYQRQNIGKNLIKQIQRQTDPQCKINLTAAPQAVEYYPHIGFTAHPSAWVLSEPLQ